MRSLFIIIILAFVGLSCKTTQNLSKKDPISRMIDTSSVLSNSFTGFSLVDLATKNTIYERNSDRYFTPASNTKLFTYYACIKTLGDSIPALRYKISGDSLLFWGTADPTFFHPDLKSTKTFDFLKAYKKTKKYYFSDYNFTNQALGEGWSWDDYNDYYAAEMSALPMYGNIVRVNIKNQQFKVNPTIFENSFYKKDEGTIIKRTVHDSQFLLPKSLLQSADYKQDIPFKTSSGLVQQLLMDTLKKNVSLTKIPVAKDAQTIFSMPVDSVYKPMMQQSDNMLAEHLLLLCGATLKDSLNSSFVIKTITEKYLQDLPDAIQWVDGSGISRYNLFTPRTIIKLLEKLHAEVSQERLFSTLAIGGTAGTIRGMFKIEDGKPYVFAKSGTLGATYNLSGFLITKSGKTLIFSIMNNNFTHPASKVRKEVEKILTWVYLNK
jgi:serine-type D-Ala-D-Ala carboxypeptidase/endopeptidase (penicillin-binding protein 4)